MESKDILNKVEEQRQSTTINSNNQLNNLKSDYFIRKFFEYISQKKNIKNNKI